MKPPSSPDVTDGPETPNGGSVQPVVLPRRCLAVLQNMWVRDPNRVRASILRHGEQYRRRFIRYALFAGCLTGRRIEQAFDEALLAEMEFEEASREISAASSAAPKADPEHIAAALSLHKPEVVITFGRIAGDAVATIWRGRQIRGPHPAARHNDVMIELRLAAAKLREALARDNDQALRPARSNEKDTNEK